MKKWEIQGIQATLKTTVNKRSKNVTKIGTETKLGNTSYIHRTVILTSQPYLKDSLFAH